MKELGAALGRLDPASRALLELSLRRGMADGDIAGILRVAPEEVARRRADTLERLAGDLRLDGREERDELHATLPDLAPEYWKG